MKDEIEGLIALLLREGSRTDAVRLYQDETGASKDEAKRFVAEVARQNGIARGRSYWLLLALLLGSSLLLFTLARV